MKIFTCDECQSTLQENNMLSVKNVYKENQYHGSGVQNNHLCDWECLYAYLMKEAEKFNWGQIINDPFFKRRYQGMKNDR